MAPLVRSIKKAGKPISNHAISYVSSGDLVLLGNDPIPATLKIPIDKVFLNQTNKASVINLIVESSVNSLEGEKSKDISLNSMSDGDLASIQM